MAGLNRSPWEKVKGKEESVRELSGLHETSIIMGRRFFITVLVIVSSLRPAGRKTHYVGSADGQAPPGYTPVPWRAIPSYPVLLEGADGSGGRGALFFPDCAAAAAPFVLFRLKREGYSGCRASAVREGLLVDALR